MSRLQIHHYGDNVFLFDDPFLNGLLAELCSPATVQPKINHLVQLLYTHLLTRSMSLSFPVEKKTVSTRMASVHPEARVTYSGFKPNQRVVSVNIARAGTYPSHICYDALHYAVQPEYLRQDHIYAARTTSGENKVTGTEIGATKIGGDVEDAIVLFPDPMGATGNTLIAAIDYYKKMVPGRARSFVALHLIVTPEYLKKVLTAHPEVQVFAVRLDRGLSSQAVLNSPLGQHWDQEKGLNEKGYIVPGGGGFGEIMNNSFV